MVVTLIQNIALVVMLATAHRHIARMLSARPAFGALASGAVYGVVVAIGMLMPFDLVPGVIYDGRSIIMSLAGLFGGAPVALVAGAIGAAYRVFLGGPGVVPGVLAIVTSGLLGVGLRRWRSDRLTSLSIADLLAFGLVVHVVMLGTQYLLLPAGLGSRVVREVGPLLLTLFPLATAIAARMMIDQLEREQTRIALVDESSRLRLAMAAAEEGTWDLDVASGTMTLSAEAVRLMELGEGPVALSSEAWHAGIHPDDRTTFDAHIAALGGERGEEPTLHFRRRHPDGRYRWYQLLGTVSDRDTSGAPTHALGIVADISRTLRTAEAIERRALEAELLAVASARLLRARDADAVYETVRDFFAAVFPGQVVIIAEVEPPGDTLVIRDVLGDTADRDDGSGRSAGPVIRGERFAMEPAHRRILAAGRLERIEATPSGSAFRGLPATLAHMLERMPGIAGSWGIGIADPDVAYAGVVVLTRETELEIPGGVVESFANLCFVTLERLRTQERLAESEGRFRLLVDTAPEAIFVQTEHRFSYVNEATVRLYGARSADELIGRPVVERIRPDLRAMAGERIRALNDDRRAQTSMEIVHLRMDGTEVDVETSGAPIVYDGKSGAVVFARDVTEGKRSAAELVRHRNHLEELVVERTHDLEAVNAELRRTTDAKAALFAHLSHELRTPLNSIIGFSSILKQRVAGPLTEEQDVEVGMINSAGRHLLTIINDLLDLTRAEAGRLRVDREAFDAGALLVEVADIVRPLAAEARLALRTVVPAHDVRLESDPMKVKRILLNLAGNAVKFTREGEVELRLTSDDHRVCFSVVDTGPGIPPSQIARIFEPFDQGDAAPGLVHEGTGLGLAISRELARLLGGDILVASEPGRGSTFSLMLPRSTEGDPAS